MMVDINQNKNMLYMFLYKALKKNEWLKDEDELNKLFDLINIFDDNNIELVFDFQNKKEFAEYYQNKLNEIKNDKTKEITIQTLEHFYETYELIENEYLHYFKDEIINQYEENHKEEIEKNKMN